MQSADQRTQNFRGIGQLVGEDFVFFFGIREKDVTCLRGHGAPRIMPFPCIIHPNIETGASFAKSEIPCFLTSISQRGQRLGQSHVAKDEIMVVKRKQADYHEKTSIGES